MPEGIHELSTELIALEDSLCGITRALPFLYVWSFYFYNILKGDIWVWRSNTVDLQQLIIFRMSEKFLPSIFLFDGSHGTVKSLCAGD